MDLVPFDSGRIVGAPTRLDPVVADAIDDFLDDDCERRLMDWIAKVRHGDFAAIPAVVTFEEACAVASLIDGFGVAGGILESFAIGNRAVGDILRFGRTRASALDAWIAVHGWCQAHRRGGLPPTEEDAILLRRLVGHLRVCLNGLSAKQKAGIMSTIRREDALQSRR